MPAFPDLSALPMEQSTDGLLQQMFTVQHSPPKPWELAWPDQGNFDTLADGSIANVIGEGPPVLFVHGFEGRYTQFWPVAERLLNKGARIIGLTLPGHGAAEGHPNPLAFSQSVTAAYHTYGSFQGIVGHSQGAIASLHAVAAGVETKALSLISPVPSVEAHLRMVCRLVKLSSEGADVFLNKVVKMVGVPISEFDATNLAAKVKTPTLIIHDKKDKEVAFDPVKALSDDWSSARLMETNGLGHRRILNDETVVTQISRSVFSAGDILAWDRKRPKTVAQFIG